MIRRVGLCEKGSKGKLFKVIEVTMGVGDILKAKAKIREVVRKEGFDLMSLNLLTDSEAGKRGIEYIGVVKTKGDMLLKKKKKPVTRGGKPIGNPQQGRTMAHARRVADQRRNQ